MFKTVKKLSRSYLDGELTGSEYRMHLIFAIGETYEENCIMDIAWALALHDAEAEVKADW